MLAKLQQCSIFRPDTEEGREEGATGNYTAIVTFQFQSSYLVQIGDKHSWLAKIAAVDPRKAWQNLQAAGNL